MSNELKYYNALKRIARGYQTVEQLRRSAGAIGLTPTEHIEMAYENVREEAERAIKGQRRPRPVTDRPRPARRKAPAPRARRSADSDGASTALENE